MKKLTNEQLDRAQEIGNKFLSWSPENGGTPCPINICDKVWFKKLCGLGETHVAPLSYVGGKWRMDRLDWTKHVLAWREMPKVKSGDFAKKIFSNKQSDIIASNS